MAQVAMLLVTLIILFLGFYMLWNGMKDGMAIGLVLSLGLNIVAMGPMILAFNLDMNRLFNKFLIAGLPVIIFALTISAIFIFEPKK